MRMDSKAVVAAGFAAFVIAVYLWFTGARDSGIFVGLWVPSLFALATYLKR